VLYTDNVRGFSWDNAVRVPCPLSASDIMSVVIGCHADMSANFRNDPGHFLCPGQSNFFFFRRKKKIKIKTTKTYKKKKLTLYLYITRAAASFVPIKKKRSFLTLPFFHFDLLKTYIYKKNFYLLPSFSC
jgi:hypothetical protein